LKSAILQHRRRLRVVAQDPDVLTKDGRILTTEVDIPDEVFEEGPRGARIHVVDYDASTGTFYQPLSAAAYDEGFDPYRIDENGDDPLSDDTILNDPRFHAQNAFGIAMRTLTRFEASLGRRVGWSFGGHQLKLAPHAFADANAFYAKECAALLFGYFIPLEEMSKPAAARVPVFTSLSHDIVAHETTHAILDGLRARYIDPSSPDQAGFHEGFADVVALLSVLASKDIAGVLIDPGSTTSDLALSAVERHTLIKNSLFGLADQMGRHMGTVRNDALRRSVDLTPEKVKQDPDTYTEAHGRGEVLVAAVMKTYLDVWVARLDALKRAETIDRARAVEEGCAAADTLLTIAIRALDYLPPTDVQFCDYVSAILTSDGEARPDDTRFGLRDRLRKAFAEFGITAAGTRADGTWSPPADGISTQYLRFDALQRDPEEVFQFVWQNRVALDLAPKAFTRVLSVRPAVRVSPEGFVLRETVAEYTQQIDLTARELLDYGIRKPERMSDAQPLTIYGGGTLIFDDWGRLKYHVFNRVQNNDRQSRKLKYLFEQGFYETQSKGRRSFAALHRAHLFPQTPNSERW
jgi:hypothetical protein